MATISARRFVVLSRPFGKLSSLNYIVLRPKGWWPPLPMHLYYLPEPGSWNAGRAACRRRTGLHSWRWGQPLPAKFYFALVAAAIRDGAITVNRDNRETQ